MTHLLSRIGKNMLTLIAACLLVAGCIGTGIGDHPIENDSDDHAGAMRDEHSAVMHADGHEDYEVPDSETLPIITGLTVTPDPKSGYNVHVQTEHFRWAPEHASMDHAPGEGHAHLYVDDVKINRMYGEWYYLTLAPGAHTVRVSLNTNDHRRYTHAGTAAEATLDISVPE